MQYLLDASLIVSVTFVCMLVLLEIGRRAGRRRAAHDAEGVRAGLGAVEGAVFGLLGLLIAFTFSGAASRFDTRRQQIIEEANAISTAYLRLDMLPPDTQPALRAKFLEYLDARIEVYRLLPDVVAARAELARTAALQMEIWNLAVAACRAAGPQAPTMLVLPALNTMIDITTTRTMATQMHPPWIIFALLFGLALTGALLAGFGMAISSSRSWVHMLGFAVAMALALYVIVDIEYPRQGLIRVDAFDQVLVDLRQLVK